MKTTEFVLPTNTFEKINTGVRSIKVYFLIHWLAKVRKKWHANIHNMLSIAHMFILTYSIVTTLPMMLELPIFPFYASEKLGKEVLNILFKDTPYSWGLGMRI